MWEPAFIGAICIWTARILAKEAVAVTETNMGRFFQIVISVSIWLQAMFFGVVGYFLLVYAAWNSLGMVPKV